jgi:hypothetical protein
MTIEQDAINYPCIAVGNVEWLYMMKTWLGYAYNMLLHSTRTSI